MNVERRGLLALVCLLMIALVAVPCGAAGCAVRCGVGHVTGKMGECGMTGMTGASAGVKYEMARGCVVTQAIAAEGVRDAAAVAVMPIGISVVRAESVARGTGSVAPQMRGRAPGVMGSCWRV